MYIPHLYYLCLSPSNKHTDTKIWVLNICWSLLNCTNKRKHRMQALITKSYGGRVRMRAWISLTDLIYVQRICYSVFDRTTYQVKSESDISCTVGKPEYCQFSSVSYYCSQHLSCFQNLSKVHCTAVKSVPWVVTVQNTSLCSITWKPVLFTRFVKVQQQAVLHWNEGDSSVAVPRMHSNLTAEVGCLEKQWQQ